MEPFHPKVRFKVTPLLVAFCIRESRYTASFALPGTRGSGGSRVTSGRAARSEPPCSAARCGDVEVDMTRWLWKVGRRPTLTIKRTGLGHLGPRWPFLAMRGRQVAYKSRMPHLRCGTSCYAKRSSRRLRDNASNGARKLLLYWQSVEMVHIYISA